MIVTALLVPMQLYIVSKPNQDTIYTMEGRHQKAVEYVLHSVHVRFVKIYYI